MLVEHEQRFFEIVDNGGMGIEDVDNLTKEVEQQITTGIEEADVILFVVDTKTGLVSLDEEVAERLRKVEKNLFSCWLTRPITQDWTRRALEFHRLGRGWLIRSASSRIAIAPNCSTKSWPGYRPPITKITKSNRRE